MIHHRITVTENTLSPRTCNSGVALGSYWVMGEGLPLLAVAPSGLKDPQQNDLLICNFLNRRYSTSFFSLFLVFKTDSTVQNKSKKLVFHTPTYHIFLEWDLYAHYIFSKFGAKFGRWSSYMTPKWLQNQSKNLVFYSPTYHIFL